MVQDQYALKSKEVVNLVFLGDTHIGNSSFNKNFFKECLKRIKDLNRVRIYLMGDMLEIGSKNVGDSAFNQECSIEEQREYFINNIKPFKDNIVGYAMGNHCYRLKKEFNYDIVADICRELEIPSYNQNIDTFSINDFDFSVYTRHGKGSSQRRHLAIGKMEKDMQDIVADLYVQGHTHRLMFWSNLKRFPTGYKRIYYAQSGHFLDYGESYADQQYLQLEPPSWQLITVNQNRLVKCHQYFAEID